MSASKPTDKSIPSGARSAIIGANGQLCLAAMHALMATLDDVRVRAGATDGFRLVALAARWKPTLVVLGRSLSRLCAFEVIGRVRQASPESRVVLILDHPDSTDLLRALRAGAHAVLLRTAPVSHLARALRADGPTPFVCRQFPRAIVHRCLREVQRHPTSRQVLTPRQREVLQLLAEGNCVKTIATMMGLSAKTVESHRQAICIRLGIHNVAGLVRYAIREGILRP